MAQNKQTLYSEYLRKVEPLADKKFRKLEAISGTHLYNPNRPQGSQGIHGAPDFSNAAQEASVLEEATKAKAALRRDVDENKKQYENLNEFVSALNGKMDEMEVAQNTMIHALEALGEQCRANQQKNIDSFAEMSETCKRQFSSVESARKRLEDQLMAKITATERTITTARREELANAAKERKALASDAEAIKTSIYQLRDEMIELDSKREAKFNCFASKNAYEISLVRDAITEEVSEVGRYLDRTKDNIEQQIKDLQAFVDRTNADVEKETKEYRSKMKVTQEELLEMVRNNDEKQSRDVETKANFLLDRLAQERSKLEASVRDERKWAELRLEEQKKASDELRGELKEEVAARILDRDALLSEIARECMQREKDESSIITAIEGVVKQINHMNQAEAR